MDVYGVHYPYKPRPQEKLRHEMPQIASWPRILHSLLRAGKTAPPGRQKWKQSPPEQSARLRRRWRGPYFPFFELFSFWAAPSLPSGVLPVTFAAGELVRRSPQLPPREYGRGSTRKTFRFLDQPAEDCGGLSWPRPG